MDVFKTLILDTPDSISSITGLGTNVATFLATPTSANLAAALTDETGTGSSVFANSPTLVTPVLGAATATSINKVTVTAPASGSTLTIANGKTLTASNTLTLAGTDSTTMTFPSTSATIARTDTGQTFTGAQTFSSGLSVTATGTSSFAGQINATSAAGTGTMGAFQNVNTTAYVAATQNTQNALLTLTRNAAAGTGRNIFIQFADVGSVVGALGIVQNASGRADFVWNQYGTDNVYATRMQLSSDGALSVLGGSITGGAGNMTITAGTGNSRTMALQTTSGAGAAQTNLTLNADLTSTFGAAINVPSSINSTGGNGLTSTGTGGANGQVVLSSVASGGGASVIFFQDTGANKWLMGYNASGANFGLYDYTATAGLALEFTAGSKNASFKSTTEATTGGAGSLTTSGGIYATKAIISGSTTASTSTTTGSAVFGGGIGVAGKGYFGNDVQSATNLKVVSSGDAYTVIDRAATNNAAAIKLYTNGTQNWFIGSSATGTNTDIEFYNYAGSLVALKLANTTGAVSVGSNLNVASGTVGIGTTAGSTIALDIRPTTLTGNDQTAVYSSPLASSAATVAGSAMAANLRTAAASFTMTNGRAIYIGSPSVGAASAITTMTGLYVTNQGASGITNAYGIDIAAQSGAATTNVGLRNAGTSLLTGSVAIGGATVSSTTAIITPASTTGVSSLRIPHGSAPSSPVDGDMWTTTAGLFIRINGSTVGPLS